MSPTRLTSREVLDRATSEEQLLEAVTDLAATCGWEYVHFRPARTAGGYRTPVQGTIGKGFPDLVLVRRRDRRVIFAELKSQLGRPDADQLRVLALLGGLEWDFLRDEEHRAARHLGRPVPRIQVVVWRPSDHSSGAVAAALR